MSSRLKYQNQRLAALYAIALDLLNHHKVEEVLSTIVLRASELLEAPFCLLDLLDGDTLVIQGATEMVQSLKGQRVPLRTAHLTRLAIKTRQPQFVEDYMKRPDRLKIHDPYRLHAACTVPIMIHDQAAGAISLGRIEPNKPFTDDDLNMLRSLAHLAAVALDSANLFEAAQKQSLTDGLTGLANRSRFDAYLAQEWSQAMRARKPLALIMVDLDWFKNFNDTYGHADGDECLRRIARVLESVGRRGSDLAARYGGEELALILPLTRLAAAQRMAEDLRSQVEALKIPHQASETGPWVTVSAGVAALVPPRKSNPINLINLADGALYKAKRSGKNCVRSVGATTLRTRSGD